jgi:hypothetical protein
VHLRAAGDPDDRLAADGRKGLHDWVSNQAPTVYRTPAPEQAESISRMLPGLDLPPQVARRICFAAALPYTAPHRTAPLPYARDDR